MKEATAKRLAPPQEPPAEILRRAIRWHLGQLHTALPASVISYNAAKSQASVQPLLKRRWADGKTDSLPIISNVPVAWTATAAASFTMKLAKGDVGMIVCIERSMDSWLAGTGQEVIPQQARFHDLSDAVFLPGLQPFSTAKPGSANLDMRLGAGTAVLSMDGGKATLDSTDTVVSQGLARIRMSANKVELGANGVGLLQTLNNLLAVLAVDTNVTAATRVAAAAANTAIATMRGTL